MEAETSSDIDFPSESLLGDTLGEQSRLIQYALPKLITQKSLSFCHRDKRRKDLTRLLLVPVTKP